MNYASISYRRLLLLPVFVLIMTRLGIELSVHILPVKFAWILAFAIYYLSVELSLHFLKAGSLFQCYSSALLPLPKIKYWLIGLLLPALLPLGVIISNYQSVPPSTWLYICVFALINPFFEEVFWRGIINQLPINTLQRQLVSATLFSFSHFFLWGAYWLSNPRLLIPTCITTFIMGWCWMWFYQRDGRLIYPVFSHMVVDLLNLSIAVFMGVHLVGA